MGFSKRFRIAATACVSAAALIAGAGAAAASPGAGPGRSPVVGTADGRVQGKSAGATAEYLGIPYAAPPVGALRWQPPHPAASWHGIREAASFAPHCAQPASPFGVASTSENCLYLNVFAPAGAWDRNLPVMVWIHGGALVVGESDDYNPAALVRDGVIVVTINYRLGALGFLADSALAKTPGGPSGNYGLMDQQAALRWVQRNIRGFGGDPRDVTVFGESAGGLSTLSQLVSPGARGLFQRAIVESGTYALGQQSLASAESAGAAFAAKAGCSTDTAACLRSLPVSTILANEDSAGYQPNVDAAVLPQSIGTALASGQFSRVPVIIGTNHDEWRLFVGLDQLEGAPPVTAANYVAEISSTLGVPTSIATVVASEYPLSSYSSPAVALGAVGTDAIFACPAVSAEDDLSKYTPTYAYEFNDENAPERFLPSLGFPYGAAHASEIQYLFDLSNSAFPGVLSGSQQKLARDMKRFWTSFAKAGTPAAGWPKYAATDQRALSLVPPRPQLETDYSAEHNCSFWGAA
ncbi:MAG TPA: carboxylesterase family protein [Trebonia sp.]|jgi:para-nitrobenzyl esterase|nr:carboxylesterase family protein [Trebonia sp.]